MRNLLLFCLLFAFAACQKAPPVTSGPERPQILVSIAPYRFLAERVAGPGFEVQTVVPMGANPHSFEPTSQEVARMEKAAIWFCIGEPFEAKIVPVLKRRNPNLVVVDLRKGIPMIAEDEHHHCSDCSSNHSHDHNQGHHQDHLDRHIWLSPKRAALQVKQMEEALKARFSTEFRENAETLSRELADLDEEIKNLLHSVQNRAIVVSHPAFGYFCQDYGIEQLSVEFEGKDPRPKQLEKMLHKARAENASVALALPQYNNKGAQRIAEELNVPVAYIDPYSSDYFFMMRQLTHLILEEGRD
jgi:zinc transport system substrate-binding protein